MADNNTRSTLKQAWKDMKQRCSNPKRHNYYRYGGRGIKVCVDWQSFDGFYFDMKDSYRAGLTLDCINNDGNYEPSNCRWATPKEQAINRRNTHYFDYKGESKTLTDWARELGIKRSTLAQRIYVYKWSVSRTLGGY